MSSIVDEIAALARDVLGTDFLPGQEISADTSFSDDLGLESIEFVELWEKVQQRYGQRVNISAIIAEMDIDAITGITVGQLAGHIDAQLAAAG